MLQYYRKNKNKILNLSLKKIYSYFFLNDIKPTGYYVYLKNLVFEFLQFKYPDYNKENFEKKLTLLIKSIDDYKDFNNELNILFDPKFNDNLEFHYKYIEKKIFFKFILNSLNKKLINNKYSKVYDFAINEMKEPLKILEIGGGLPHGFIYNFWKKEGTFFEKFNYIDANLLHSEFVRWYCNKLKIPNEIKLFPPAKTPILEKIEFNFVFAKDIFEHLDDPETIIEYLISNTNDKKTLLCLDLEHKGKKVGQHINPNLPIFKEKLLSNNFKVIEIFDEVHVWRRN